jgi:hypothetical protein
MVAVQKKKPLWEKVKGKAITAEHKEADKKAKNLIMKTNTRFGQR